MLVSHAPCFLLQAVGIPLLPVAQRGFFRIAFCQLCVRDPRAPLPGLIERLGVVRLEPAAFLLIARLPVTPSSL